MTDGQLAQTPDLGGHLGHSAALGGSPVLSGKWGECPTFLTWLSGAHIIFKGSPIAFSKNSSYST